MATSDVAKGAEVHNTYGELGNTELTSKYGFALYDNPFSAVALDKASLLQAAESFVGARDMRRRCKFLRMERYGLLICHIDLLQRSSLAHPLHSKEMLLIPALLLAVSSLMRLWSPLRFCQEAALDPHSSSPYVSPVLMTTSSTAGGTWRMPCIASSRR